MIRIADIVLPLHQQGQEDYLKKMAAKRLHVAEDAIQSCSLYKKSVDARKKEEIHFICTVEVELPQEKQIAAKCQRKDKKITLVEPYRYSLPSFRALPERPVVVGMGPAGLFAGLILAQAGQRPLIVERGADVDQRTGDVEAFWQTGILQTESNVQFGEGGAGTFSDGKLHTGTKDIRCRKVLEELVKAGAPEAIRYTAHPHVGTDLLPAVVKRIRESILSLGGEIRFHTKLTRLLFQGDQITGVVLQKLHGTSEMVDTRHVILAIGHSARDTYEMLYEAGVKIEAKAFSIGARIEHRQAQINRAQFGKFAQEPELGAAEYKLSAHLPNGRGVYTFCMCPGGTVVASASETGRVVTNGMSVFARDGENANAALLVGVGPADFGSGHPLAGMAFQRKWEERAFQAGGGGYIAPAQRVEDFLKGIPSTALGDVRPTYSRGVCLANVGDCLPEEIVESMREGIRVMDRRLPGFSHPDALLTGVETRSSAPVRLLRHADCQSVSFRGLYPCGEGAGYAGGIMSAAVDGIRCAEQVLHHSLNKEGK